jgi:serine protease Do
MFAPQAAEPESFLGVYLAEVGPKTVAQLDLPAERGAHVRQVMDESPAAAAGIRADDVIVAWDAIQVGSAVQFKRLVSETPPGRTVKTELIREGEIRTVEVTVGRRPDPEDGGFGFSPAPIPFDQWHPDIPSLLQDPYAARQAPPPRLGIEMQALSEQLAAFFGLEDGRLGVLVAGVQEGSAAAEAGLRAGDVIVRVDGRDVESIPEVQRAVSAAGDAVELGVVRDGSAMTVTAALPPADETGADDVRELVIPAEEDPAAPAGAASPGAPRYPKEAM